MPSIRVNVWYRERIAMPPDATVVVTVADVARADAPAIVLAERRVEDPGNVPVAVEVEYDPSQLDPRAIYAVRATIEIDGALWWSSTEHHRVLADDTPDALDVMVTRVAR
jgi:putative lipoprotein